MIFTENILSAMQLAGACPTTIQHASKGWNHLKSNKNGPEGDEIKDCREWLAKWVDCPEDFLKAMLADKGNKTIFIRAALGSNTALSVFDLRELATDKETNVRMAVAANPSTPLDLLEKFTEDCRSVRAALATNPKLPSNLKDAMILIEEDDWVKMHLSEPTQHCWRF